MLCVTVGDIPMFVGRFGGAVVDWVGHGTKLDNPAVNVLNTTEAYAGLLDSYVSGLKVLECGAGQCQVLQPFFKSLETLLSDGFIPATLSNLTYLPVCLVQQLINTAAPPVRMSKCLHLLSNAAFGAGRFLDDVPRQLLAPVMINAVPRYFVGTGISRLFIAGFSAVGDLLDSIFDVAQLNCENHHAFSHSVSAEQ